MSSRRGPCSGSHTFTNVSFTSQCDMVNPRLSRIVIAPALVIGVSGAVRRYQSAAAAGMSCFLPSAMINKASRRSAAPGGCGRSQHEFDCSQGGRCVGPTAATKLSDRVTTRRGARGTRPPPAPWAFTKAIIWAYWALERSRATYEKSSEEHRETLKALGKLAFSLNQVLK